VSPVNARMHALLARELIDACGGLDEAVGACRLQKSRLSECQNPDRPPDQPAYLPADVIADLEAYCGKPLYSRVLAEARPSAPDGKSIVEEISDATEDMAELQRLVRKVRSTGRPMTPRERLVVDAAVLRLREELGDVLAQTESGGEL